MGLKDWHPEIVRNVCGYSAQLRCRQGAEYVDQVRSRAIQRKLIRILPPTKSVAVCDADMDDVVRCYELAVQQKSKRNHKVRLFRKMYVLACGKHYVFTFLQTKRGTVGELVI